MSYHSSVDIRTFASKGFKKVTHCIFDLDGTVLNSEIIYHERIRDICESYGRKYGGDLQVRMYGVTDKEICKSVCQELKLPISPDELCKQLEYQLKKTLPSAPLQAGAERLLTHLYDFDIPMAIATNSTEHAVRVHAGARPKLFGMFHHIVSATDPEVDRGKPQPDLFLVAASRFPDKPKPHKCLVFEDSAIGVEAAREAGMQVVMIPDPRLDREHTRRASLVIRSMLDFKPELFGLPPFQDSPESKKRMSPGAIIDINSNSKSKKKIRGESKPHDFFKMKGVLQSTLYSVLGVDFGQS